MATCKACGAEIIWKKTVEGKNMPLDAKPRKMAVLEAAFAHGVEIKAEPCVKIVDAYTTHWETCPEADRFRRSKGDQR